jgi:aryl-alcohol dehydrogenase-like predicted oxidoreductase
MSEHTFKIGGEIEVNRLGFGAMRITGKGVWGMPNDKAGVIALLKHVASSGVMLIDTADSYGPNTSEELIAEALYPYPPGLTIATKVGLVRPGPDVWNVDGNPERLKKACDGSLQRLKLDCIDLYQLHRIDSKVPLADQIGALTELQAQGKIRHIGLSEVSVKELREVQTMTKVATVQNRYNLADKGSEALLDVCTEEGIGFIPWYPLGGGDMKAISARMERIAAEQHATPHQIALAWLLKRAPVILPIPGTASIAHFDENMGALEIDLEEEDYLALAA